MTDSNVGQKSWQTFNNKDVEGFLQTLYAFCSLSPCAIEIAQKQYYGNNDVFQNTSEWRRSFNYTDARVKQGLKELHDKGFVRKGQIRGFYQLEPTKFLRGEFTEIRLIFRDGEILIDYDEKH